MELYFKLLLTSLVFYFILNFFVTRRKGINTWIDVIAVINTAFLIIGFPIYLLIWIWQ